MYSIKGVNFRFLKPKLKRGVSRLCIKIRNGVTAIFCSTRKFVGVGMHHFRHEFKVRSIPVKESPTSNPDAQRASTRAAAREFVTSICLSAGVEPFIHQMSAAEQRSNCRGTREHYWPKDHVMNRQNDRLVDSDVVTIVDVDYYIDMPKYLSRLVNPVFLYTMVPEEAAGVFEGYDMSFNSQNELVVNHAGGLTFQHKLWDYGKDVIVLNRYFRFLPFLLRGQIAFEVQRKRVAVNRELIMLLPVWRRSVWQMLRDKARYPANLKRFEPVVNGYARFRIKTPQETKITTAAVGSLLCVTTSVAADDAVQAAIKVSRHPIVAHTVESLTNLDKARSLGLLAYTRETTPLPAPYRYPVQDAVNVYHFNPEVIPVDAGRAKVVPFMNPLVPASFVPGDSLGNEEASVAYRVIAMRSRAKEIAPAKSCLRDSLAQEFIKLLVPVEGVVIPRDADDVYENMDRPAQRHGLDRGDMVDQDALLRQATTMLKSESYSEVKAPRTITMFNASDKLKLACYEYAVSQHLKETDWYAFGKNPRDIGETVARVCDGARSVTESDASKMDGHYVEPVREFLLAVRLRMFPPKYRAEMARMYRTHMNLPCRGPHGTKYPLEHTLGSGSMTTSNDNSILSKFMDYGARRLPNNHGNFFTPTLGPEEAYASRGVFGGDDGLSRELEPDRASAFASYVGQELKPVLRLPGNPVTFLARYYGPGVWLGDPNSMCDVLRQLSKFHTTVNCGATARQKLIEKSRSYSYTDSETPIIGAFVMRVVLFAKGLEFQTHYRELERWNVPEDENDQPVNHYDSWMDEVVERTMPEFDRVGFTTWLKTTRTVHDLLNPPCFHPATVVTCSPVGTVHVQDQTFVGPADIPATGLAPPRDSGPSIADAERLKDTCFVRPSKVVAHPRPVPPDTPVRPTSSRGYIGTPPPDNPAPLADSCSPVARGPRPLRVAADTNLSGAPVSGSGPWVVVGPRRASANAARLGDTTVVRHVRGSRGGGRNAASPRSGRP